MGTVYLAEQDCEPTLVAVKRIHEHMAEIPRFRRMFADETRIAARIDHPNVCGVLAFGEIDDTPYLAMPFLRGRPLSQVMKKLREKGPSRENAMMMARIAVDVCAGLHAAHELSGPDGNLEVVHRDVSPHNLFVGFDGVTRLLDFGVASAREKLASTASGEVKGKLGYMAPENLDGIGIDRRADVWSLGVVLWESIAGEKLFDSESMGEVVKAILQDPIPSLSDYSMEVPLGLEEVIFRALARNRDARYASAATMREDLLVMFEDEGTQPEHEEIAIWMAALFPSGERETGELVRAAVARDRDDTPVEPFVASADSEAGDTTNRSFGGSFMPKHKRWWMPWALASASVAALVAFSVVRGRTPEPTPVARSNPPVTATADAGGYQFELPPEPTPEVGAIVVEATVDMASESEAGTSESEAGTEVPEASTVQTDEPSMRRVPRMRPRAMSMEAVGEGTLHVVTPGGWGIVRWRGRTLGEAPGSFRLPSGSHRIEVRPFGRGPAISRRVSIRPARTARVSVSVR